MVELLNSAPAAHHADGALRSILGVHQVGKCDPTTQAEPGGWWHATLTPDGPATVHIWWGRAGIDAQSWGPGADHLLAKVPEFIGDLDVPVPLQPSHPAVARAQRNYPHMRMGRSRNLYHALLPIIIAQRVTGGEAIRSWRGLCRQLGRMAPGPRPLLVPPSPEVLADQPYWWFHRLGIERKRADTLRGVGRHIDVLRELDEVGDPEMARTRLQRLCGIGIWTVGESFGAVFGDPDAFAIGDYWLKHTICDALAGEPRGTDERMVELLDPYRGQRGRVVRLLLADGWRPQRFGPGKRIIPIAEL